MFFVLWICYCSFYLQLPDCYPSTQTYSVRKSQGVISANLESSTITFTFPSDRIETVTVLLTDTNGVQYPYEDISFSKFFQHVDHQHKMYSLIGHQLLNTI